MTFICDNKYSTLISDDKQNVPSENMQFCVANKYYIIRMRENRLNKQYISMWNLHKLQIQQIKDNYTIFYERAICSKLYFVEVVYVILWLNYETVINNNNNIDFNKLDSFQIYFVNSDFIVEY